MALSEQEVEFGTNFIHVMSTTSVFVGVSSITMHALGSPMEILPVEGGLFAGFLGVVASIGTHFISRFGSTEAITIEDEQEERRARYEREAAILNVKE